MRPRADPGPCPICGEAHTACTTTTGPIVIVQTPARDALAEESVSPEPVVVTSFSTATYRGKKAKP